ncbi:MAG: methyltransferase domain-containing protein [Bacteroidota bacterium]
MNADYWEERWQNDETRWDIGYASPPLIRYTEQLDNKEIRILIPGAGRAHEAAHLHRTGFTQVYVCDWAETAFTHLKQSTPDFPAEHLIIGDFFDLDYSFDLLLEQTFFCAIDPALRPKYVEQAARLLQPKGKLAGLLFNRDFQDHNPPYGGTQAEYEQLFRKYFNILQLATSEHSIPSRLGAELFIELAVK